MDINRLPRIQGSGYFNLEPQNKEFSNSTAEALRLIETKMADKTSILNVEQCKYTDWPEILKGSKDAEYVEELKNLYKRLKETLSAIAKKSDITAKFVMTFLKNDKTSIVIPDKRYGNRCGTSTGEYRAADKELGVSKDILVGNNQTELEDVVFHELVHAVDDLSRDETGPGGPQLFSSQLLKQQIEPLLSEEAKKSKEIYDFLENKRMDELKKQFPTSFSTMTETEIRYNKLPPCFIDKNHAEELNWVKEKTWCWQCSEDDIFLPMVCHATGLGANPSKDLFYNQTIREYIASGLEFYFSNDKSKRERLKKQGPKFYAFLEQVVIPKLTEN